jgi:hypothetical protein
MVTPRAKPGKAKYNGTPAYALGGEPPDGPDLADLREFRVLGDGGAAVGLTRIRIDRPFGSSISNEFVFRTRSLSLRKP